MRFDDTLILLYKFYLPLFFHTTCVEFTQHVIQYTSMIPNIMIHDEHITALNKSL